MFIICSIGLLSRFAFASSSCNSSFGLWSDLVIIISSSESSFSDSSLYSSDSVFKSNSLASLVKTSLSAVLTSGCSGNSFLFFFLLCSLL